MTTTQNTTAETFQCRHCDERHPMPTVSVYNLQAWPVCPCGKGHAHVPCVNGATETLRRPWWR